jgi:tRNA-dihydrouridine synthase B
MKIKEVDFGDGLVLAPMAGVSDVGFRDICSRFGADATYSEMLSCRAMLHNPKKTELMTISSENEKIKIGQIFGHEIDVMQNAIECGMLDKYDIIDINMGCPAPKIVKNGEGSALMKNLPLASKIISACVEKISLEFGRMCEESGASAITLHGRTSEQGYSGKADYDAIARLKNAVKIPVIGNGDVVDLESYHNMLKTGVDGVMIGRGSQGHPWIFSELKGKNVDVDIPKIAKEHITILRKYYDENWLIKYMRKHLLWYISGQEGASEGRLKVATSPSLDESLKIIEEIFYKNKSQ